jgi:tetratricopeptide (TPR) repeat protein
MSIEQAYDFFDEGRYDESQSICVALLECDINYFPANYLLGNIKSKLGDYEGAIDSYHRALSLRPNSEVVLFNLAFISKEKQDTRRSLYYINKYISINNEDAEAYVFRSILRIEISDFHLALEDLDAALRLVPNSPETLNKKGNCLNRLKRFDEALASYDKAISIQSDYAEAFYNRGVTLCELKCFDDALASYDKAVSLKIDYAEALYNRGITLNELKRFDEALVSYEKAISINSDFAEARYAKAVNLLREESFSEGWSNYEYRFKKLDFIQNSLKGTHQFLTKINPNIYSTDLIGKHLVLIGEQGVGDVIMFASIAKDALSLVAALDFIVDDRLIKIFKNSFTSSRIFSLTNYHKADIPKDAIFMFIGSLARLFRIKDTDFTKNPYLFPHPEKVSNWRARFQSESKKVIGISWKGGTPITRDWARSFPLQTFLTFIPDQNVRFINVQHNSSIQEVQEAMNKQGFEILSFPEADTSDISDLSALLCALDHVVTVQNSNIHLCGALNVPCVGIIPSIPEWRYGLGGDKMIWYESVRLIRMGQGMDLRNVKPIVSSYLSQQVK